MTGSHRQDRSTRPRQDGGPVMGLRRTGQVLGSTVALHLADDLPLDTLEQLAETLFEWLRDVERRFSLFDEDSEVRRLDRSELSSTACSVYLRQVLEGCAQAWRDTDGFFDAYATGRLDPSGYVKGWAVEVASARLVAGGSTNHLVSAGRDVRARGCPEPGQRWHVPVRHPRRHDEAHLMLAVTDAGISTSEANGPGRPIVNPRTGAPAQALRSVTVVGPDLSIADAYATAAVAMGTPGLDWLARLDGYASAAVAEDGRWYCSEGLPVLPSRPQAAATSQTSDIRHRIQPEQPATSPIPSQRTAALPMNRSQGRADGPA